VSLAKKLSAALSQDAEVGVKLANLWMLVSGIVVDDRMDRLEQINPQMPARDRAAAIHLQIISSSSRRRHRKSSPWPASARPW
jgi:hypothetical protein